MSILFKLFQPFQVGFDRFFLLFEQGDDNGFEGLFVHKGEHGRVDMGRIVPPVAVEQLFNVGDQFCFRTQFIIPFFRPRRSADGDGRSFSPDH